MAFLGEQRAEYCWLGVLLAGQLTRATTTSQKSKKDGKEPPSQQYAQPAVLGTLLINGSTILQWHRLAELGFVGTKWVGNRFGELSIGRND